MKTNTIFKNLLLAGIFFSAAVHPSFADTDASGKFKNSQSTDSSISKISDDQSLAHNVNNVLIAQLPGGSYTVASYNSKILLAGQVSTEKDKSNAEKAVYRTHGVKKVWNYLTIGPNEDSKDIAKDAYLTSAAKARLIAQKGVNANNIKVVTSDKVIYLLGNNPGKSAQIKAAIEDIKEMDDSIKGVVNLIGK